MRAKRDGMPTGVKGVITREQQEAALGIDKAAPKPAPLPPTPSQARLEMSDQWTTEDLIPPDFERNVIDDPSAIANALGLRPDDFDAPLGSMPEGMPIAQPSVRPKIEPRPETDTAKPAPAPSESDKAELAAYFRAHAAKVAEVAASAKQSGDPAREAKAAASVAASREVGEALKARGIL